jgi:hypothetical protein
VPPISIGFLQRALKAAPAADDGFYLWDAIEGIFKRALISAISHAPARAISVTLTANQNDLNPTGLASADWLVITGTTLSAIKITGLQGGVDGRVLLMKNAGSVPILFSGEDSSSTAANRFAASTAIPVLRLSSGGSGMLIYNGTTSRWSMIPLVAGPGGEGYYGGSFVEPIMDLTTFLQTSAVGTAAAANLVASIPCNYVNLVVGTGTTNTVAVATKSVVRFDLLDSGLSVSHFTFSAPTPISDGTNRYTVRVGFLDSLTGASVDGLHLRYADNVNSGKWQLVARAASAEVPVDTGVTFVAGAWVECYFVTYGTLATPAADLYMTSNAGGTDMAYRATVTGIPGGANLCGAGASLVKALGASSRTLAFYPFAIY